MWKNLVLVVVSLALCLAAGEGLLRHVYAPEALRLKMALVETSGGSDSSLRRIHDDDGRFVRFAPGQVASIRHVEYATSASIDERGWRRSAPSPADAYDAVFVGDSFTFGIGVEDEESLPWRLAAMLERSFANLGVPGSDPARYLELIRRHHAALGEPPLYFIVVFLGNDFEAVLPPQPDAGPAAMRRAAGVLNELIFHGVLRESYAAQLLKMALNKVRARRGIEQRQIVVDQAGTTYYSRTLPPAHEQRLKTAWLAWLDQLAGLATALDTSFALLLLPDRLAVEPAGLAYLSAYYGFEPAEIDLGFKQRFLAELFAGRGVTFFDATDCLVAARQGRRFYYQSDDHLTPLGTQALARCVSGFVERTVQAAGARERPLAGHVGAGTAR